MRTIVMALVLAGASVSAGVRHPLVGQEMPPVPGGSRVRVWAPDLGVRRERAAVLTWHDSTVSFRPEASGGDTVLVPFRALRRLDVYVGKDRLRGGMVGAAIGGTVGMLVGTVIGNGAVQGCQEWLCELEALNYMAGGMAIGMALGVPVGVSAAPDKWARVDLPVAAGFPPYRPPVHETLAFRVVAAAAALVVTSLIQ